MNEPFLIQSGTRRNDGKRKGLGSIVHLNIMGYAEFEFGSLPKSLEHMCNNIGDYELFNIKLNNDPNLKVVVLSHRDDVKQVKCYIRGLACDKYQLKAFISFHEWAHPETIKFIQPSDSENFWWDIQNHYMFWKKEDSKFETDLINILMGKNDE